MSGGERHGFVLDSTAENADGFQETFLQEAVVPPECSDESPRFTIDPS